MAVPERAEEPGALKFPNYEEFAKAWRADPAKMALLDNTLSPDQIDSADYDAIYFTAGEGLQRITRELFERGAIVSSVCHGYCGLLNTKLSDGSYLITGKKMTGFAWTEEVLARVDKLVPYNAEEIAKERGAIYEKPSSPSSQRGIEQEDDISGQS